jgi:hypothetical protein
MKGGCKVFLILARVVGHHAAVGHHDLQVGCVHPDAPKEISFVLLDGFGPHIEDVAIDFVHLLPAHIFEVIFGNILLGQHERIAMLDVLEI